MPKFPDRPGVPKVHEPLKRSDATLEQRVADLERTVDELRGQLAAMQQHTHNLEWIGWMTPPWVMPDNLRQPNGALVAFTQAGPEQGKKTSTPLF